MAPWTWNDCEKWYEPLGLSMQDFAHLFGVSLSILNKIKAGDSNGKIVLPFLEMCLKTPEAIYYLLQKNGKFLHADKRDAVLDQLGIVRDRVYITF